MQFSFTKLQENGISQLSILVGLCQYDGVWNSQVLRGLLSSEKLPTEQGGLIVCVLDAFELFFLFLAARGNNTMVQYLFF